MKPRRTGMAMNPIAAVALQMALRGAAPPRRHVFIVPPVDGGGTVAAPANPPTWPAPVTEITESAGRTSGNSASDASY